MRISLSGQCNFKFMSMPMDMYKLKGNKAGNHVVLMIGYTEFRAGIRTKHV